MRLFNKNKYVARGGSANGDGAASEDEKLAGQFSKLFSDDGTENAAGQVQDVKKQSLLQDSSPVSVAEDTSKQPILSATDQKSLMSRAAQISLRRTGSAEEATPCSTASAGSMVTPASNVPSQKKPPKFSKGMGMHDSRVSMTGIPASRSGRARRDSDEFETHHHDDELFMVEEATRRDFGDIRRAVDFEEELIRTSATFRFKGNSDSSEVEISAEEIIRSQYMNAAKHPPSLGGGARPPPLAKRVSSVARPPPLFPSDSPQSCVASSVFGNEGDFSSGGFTISSAGMVTQPDFALREDLEVQTLSVGDLQANSVVMDDLKEFKRGPTIGAGAAGKVYLALHEPTSTAVAMKTVNVYDSPKRKQLLKELHTLAMHVSRYLVRFYGAYYDGAGAVHIALEFMDRGCLSSFVKKFGAIPEPIVRGIAMDCLRGLRFLHSHRVLHRDFKTANILLSRSQCCAKVSDFGLARDLNKGVSRVDTFVGTVAYMSPERLQGSEYTYASDIWALGVSLVECLLGRYPFDRPQNYFDYIETTMNSNLLDSAEMSAVSSQARAFVEICTDIDPNKRPTAEQLLGHPWLKGWNRDKEMFANWMDDCASKSVSMSSKSP